jgi:hypothetical protein
MVASCRSSTLAEGRSCCSGWAIDLAQDSAGTQDHRDERTDLQGLAAATKEEQRRTHGDHRTRFAPPGPKLSVVGGRMPGMTTWQEFTEAAPDLAARVEARLLAFTHLTMATIRADGAPRISGNEIRIRDGELMLAGMPTARRWADLRRDPRVAIHSGSAEPDPPGSFDGDAKVSGVAEEITDPVAIASFRAQEKQIPPGPFALFAVRPTAVTLVALNDTASALVIETWFPGRGVVRHERG